MLNPSIQSLTPPEIVAHAPEHYIGEFVPLKDLTPMTWLHQHRRFEQSDDSQWVPIGDGSAVFTKLRPNKILSA
jgi:hypothetical protein